MRGARAQAPGVADPGFNATSYNYEPLIVPLSDGKIYVGGYGLLARLNADGSTDTTFSPAAGVASLLAVQSDGKVLAAYSNTVARLNDDGSLDSSFQGAGVSFVIYAAAEQADGSVVVTGSDEGAGEPITVQVARFTANGSLDTSFQDGTANVSGTPDCLAVESDGKILIGGDFAYGPPYNSGLIRLNADGSRDTSFTLGFEYVQALTVLANGQILVGDQTGPYRLNADGSLDTSFNPTANTYGSVEAVAGQADGKVLVGGSSLNYDGTPEGGGVVRLNVDGSLDTSFVDATGGKEVRALAVQADGKVLVGIRASLIRVFGSPYNSTLPVKSDLNGDGVADLIWQNTVTGEHAAWFLQDGVYQSGVTLPAIAAEWTIAACADFDGDGQSDYVWQNSRTGDRVIWFCQNGELNYQIALPPAGLEWRIAGAGDLDGDGMADLVWENTETGRIDAWFLKNGVVQSVYIVGYVPTEWQVAGVGDMNGDGLADIVFQNMNDGERSVVLCQYGMPSDYIELPSIDPVWNIAGVSDFDGDGYCDLVWENSQTGERFITFMKDAVYESAVSLPAIDTDWVIANH